MYRNTIDKQCCSVSHLLSQDKYEGKQKVRGWAREEKRFHDCQKSLNFNDTISGQAKLIIIRCEGCPKSARPNASCRILLCMKGVRAHFDVNRLLISNYDFILKRPSERRQVREALSFSLHEYTNSKSYECRYRNLSPSEWRNDTLFFFSYVSFLLSDLLFVSLLHPWLLHSFLPSRLVPTSSSWWVLFYRASYRMFEVFRASSSFL